MDWEQKGLTVRAQSHEPKGSLAGQEQKGDRAQSHGPRIQSHTKASFPSTPP